MTLLRQSGMKKNYAFGFGAAMSVAMVLAMGSCAYDPYYPTAGAYSAGYGYGEGYGYGHGSFSTAMFVSTGNPRWGYDPYCYSYYDYTRRCYYDPYLYGYYPMGYRPLAVYGVPHPHGFNRSFCPPPHRISNITLTNYSNREYAYKHSSYPWAQQVRQNSGTYRTLAPAQAHPRSGNLNNPGIHGPGPSGYPRVYGGSTSNTGPINHANSSQLGVPTRSNVPLKTYPKIYSNPASGAASGHFNPSQGGGQIPPRRGTIQPRNAGPAVMPTAPQGRMGPATQGPAHHEKGKGGDEGKEGKSRSNR